MCLQHSNCKYVQQKVSQTFLWVTWYTQYYINSLCSKLPGSVWWRVRLRWSSALAIPVTWSYRTGGATHSADRSLEQGTEWSPEETHTVAWSKMGRSSVMTSALTAICNWTLLIIDHSLSEMLLWKVVHSLKMSVITSTIYPLLASQYLCHMTAESSKRTLNIWCINSCQHWQKCYSYFFFFFFPTQSHDRVLMFQD